MGAVAWRLCKRKNLPSIEGQQVVLQRMKLIRLHERSVPLRYQHNVRK